MAAYQGTYYSKTFVFKDAETLEPLDITTWEFESTLRDRLDTAELLTLTTANGGWAVTDGANGEAELRITALQTADLPVAKLVFDVLRTDASPGPVWLFAGRFSVKRPVTRDE